MKRTIIAIAAFATLSSTFAVSARSILEPTPEAPKSNWEVSVNYHSISTEVQNVDINTGIASVGFGYEFASEKGHVSVVPELRLGTGVVSDDFGDTDVEIDSMVSASARIELHPTDLFTVYARPSYTRVSVENTSSDWEFGAGVGIALKLSDNVKFALDYDRVAGDSDVVSGSLRYNF